VITPAAARLASGGWSGRRGSNPRPTAWKAVTLPLSYSRLRGPHCRPAVTCALFARCAAPRLSRQCRPALACRPTPLTTGPDPAGSKPTRPATLPGRSLAQAAPRGRRAKSGGEGRIRTSEAARATDLQSAAFDRSATSPALVERRCAAADTLLRPRVSGRSVVFVGTGCLGAYLQNPEPAQTGAGGGI
jgi:hypothetical protein